MKWKTVNFLLFSIILISILSFNVSAFFPQSHEKWTIEGFNSIKSPTTDKCRPYLNIVLDGDMGSDIGVIHYGSSNDKLLKSYIYPHTRGGYLTCLRDAGADVELQCQCIGNALHIIQDSYSHNIGGLTEKYLKKFLGSNYFGHMSVEKNFETKHLELMKKQNIYSISSGKLDYYNRNVLNSLFTETGGSSKFLTQLNSIAGIDLSNDARLFRSGYLGEGFYSTVYKDKVSLPWWAYAIAISLFIVGLGMIILILVFGRTNWKWISVLNYLLLLVIGVIIIYSFISGSTWKITTFVIEFPTHFGYLAVSDNDVVYYDNLIQKATNDFLTSTNLNMDDASGLTYYDRNGNYVKGALTKAETGFKVIWYGFIIPLYLAINIFLLYKTFKRKK